MPGPFSVAKDAGDFYTYNIHHGFPEGLVRGYRSGFLSDMVRVKLCHRIGLSECMYKQCTPGGATAVYCWRYSIPGVAGRTVRSTTEARRGPARDCSC